MRRPSDLLANHVDLPIADPTDALCFVESLPCPLVGVLCLLPLGDILEKPKEPAVFQVHFPDGVDIAPVAFCRDDLQIQSISFAILNGALYRLFDDRLRFRSIEIDALFQIRIEIG